MSLLGSTNNASPGDSSSLFANPSQNPTTSTQPSGLFGTANTSASASNLFANAGSNQSQATSAPSSNSLFSRISTSNSSTTQPSGSSLFGGTAVGGGSSGPPFGSSTAQFSAPASSGLFGSLAAQSSQPASGSLFGSAPATSTQTGGNLFSTLGGGAPTAQQSSNSLFAPKTQVQADGGLFGVATQASNGGLFGSANQTAQPSGGSLSGNTLGGGTTQSGQAQAQPGATQSGQVIKSEDAPRTALFEDLLERGKKRREEGSDSSGQLPSLQLGLGDISSKIKGLGTNKPNFSASRAHDSRAQYLLAGSGVPIGGTSKDLQAFANDPSVAQAEPAPIDDPRIEYYMAGVQAKTIKEEMDEAMEQSKRDFDSFLEDNLQINWDHQRRRVYEHLGLVKPGDREDDSTDQLDSLSVGARGAFGRSNRQSRRPAASMRGSMRGSLRDSSGLAKSVLGGSIGRGTLRQSIFKDVDEKATESGAPMPIDDPHQRAAMEGYAVQVRNLNVARIEELVFPIVEQFARVALNGGSETPKHLMSAYHALRNIVKGNSSVERPGDDGAVRERQYAAEYLTDNPNVGVSVRLRQQILDGSRNYLEDSFFSKVRELVDRNPAEASIGGMPTKTSIVHGYLRIREASRNLLPEECEAQRGESGEPIWALIFFLLRSGLVEEAAQYVVDNDRVVRTYDRAFPQYMASYASQNRNLPYALRSRMAREYQQRLNNPPKSLDPYRMACYKILGRCDVSHPRLDVPHPDIEDVVWLYFVLAREANRAEETAGDMMGLENVQSIVQDIKERIFQANPDQASGAYATCFLLQILCGMFEPAIAYLYQFNQVAAVHFALALSFYGLLRVSDPMLDMDLLTFTTRQQPQVNFARMLGYYTQSFRLARPESAAEYLTLISLNSDLPGEAGQKMVHITHEALKELTLETREFPLLIGDIRNDGRRIKGLIETRLSLITKGVSDPSSFLRTLTVQAAQAADDAGRVNDATLLYHLAEEYDAVITVVTRALSDALAIDIGAEPMRLQPLKPRGSPSDQSKPQTPQQDTMSSLSLVSVDDPATLTQNMITLYNNHALYYSKVSPPNREAAALLLRMWEVRQRIATQRWADAIDTLGLVDLLPMRAAGNITAITAAAHCLNQQPPVVARNIGNLLVWAIGACGEQRRVLQKGGWEVGGGARETERELKQTARDLMVFAGLVRYRVGGDVYEVLARAGEGLE